MSADPANAFQQEMARLVEEILEAVDRTHPAIRKKVFYVVEQHNERLGKILANPPYDWAAEKGQNPDE